MKIFLLLILFSNLIFAQDIQELVDDLFPRVSLSNDQLKALREEMKVHTMLIEGIERLNIEDGHFVNLEKATENVHDLLIRTYGARSSTLPKEVQQIISNYLKEHAKKESIKDALQQLEKFAKGSINKTTIKSISQKAYSSAVRSRVASALKGRAIWGVSLARKFGLSVGLFYLISAQVDYTLPLILMATGHAKIGMSLLAVPFSSTSTATFITMKKAFKFRNVVKKLGGLGVVLDDLKITRQIRNFFNTSRFGQSYLVDINIHGQQFVFTIEDQRIFSKLLARMGWNNKLNYSSLMNFLERNNFNSEFLARIANSEVAEEVKVLRILRRIQKDGDLSIVEKLRYQFHGLVNEVNNIPNLTQERNWIIKAANSKDFVELYSYLRNIPEGIPPKTFDKVWRNYILAQAAENIGPLWDKKNYIAFRNMFNQYDETIRKELFSSSEAGMTKELREQFGDYLFKSLNESGICELQYIPAKNIF